MTALSQALDLAGAPRLTGSMRRQPLPLDLVTLIRLAAGCRKTLVTASAATKRDPDFLVSAAELYLRQVVCFPGADPYRVLGVTARTPRAEVRRHMREFVLWLHPDRGPRGGDRALMQRVLEAWQTVSAPDAGPSPVKPAPSRPRRTATYRPVWIAQPVSRQDGARPAIAARLRLALRLALVAAGLVVPGVVPFELSGLAVDAIEGLEVAGRGGAVRQEAGIHKAGIAPIGSG